MPLSSLIERQAPQLGDIKKNSSAGKVPARPGPGAIRMPPQVRQRVRIHAAYRTPIVVDCPQKTRSLAERAHGACA